MQQSSLRYDENYPIWIFCCTPDQRFEANHGTLLSLIEIRMIEVSESANGTLSLAVAKIYELTNFLARKDTNIEQKIYGIKSLAVLMEPFTPHLAQEIWVEIGEKGFIADASWPDVRETDAEEKEKINLELSFSGMVYC